MQPINVPLIVQDRIVASIVQKRRVLMSVRAQAAANIVQGIYVPLFVQDRIVASIVQNKAAPAIV